MTATKPEAEVGTKVAAPREPTVHAMTGFDPFQAMDRFDEDALMAEMEGRVADELVYSIKDGAKEVTGLSKAGVDECCMALVTQGQVIREEDLRWEFMGEGEERDALFQVRAARFGVSPSGVEVRLDQVIGVKRQPLYYEAATPMSLDTRCPGKKPAGKTFRQMLADPDGRGYLEWMVREYREESVRVFVQQVLDGDDPQVQPGRRLNPHWYEHGAMKAARNARFRLIPGTVRAAVIERAIATGKVRRGEIDREGAGGTTQQKQPAQQKQGATLDTIADSKLPGRAGGWGGYAGKPLREVPSDILKACTEWATDKGVEAQDKKDGETAEKYFGQARRCDLVIAARQGGQLPEPPHKDGTPREGKAEAESGKPSSDTKPTDSASSGGTSGTPPAMGSTPTTSPPTQAKQREPGED